MVDGPVGAAPAPDLVEQAHGQRTLRYRSTDSAITTSDTEVRVPPRRGARFTLNAAVRNQGNGPSAFTSSPLRYYRSTDSAITTGDTEVGTDSVFSLDALDRPET